jgi:hypothetical protein
VEPSCEYVVATLLRQKLKILQKYIFIFLVIHSLSVHNWRALYLACERCGLVHVNIKNAIQNSQNWCKTYRKLFVFTVQFLCVAQDKHKTQDSCYDIKGFFIPKFTINCPNIIIRTQKERKTRYKKNILHQCFTGDSQHKSWVWKKPLKRIYFLFKRQKLLISCRAATQRGLWLPRSWGF